MTRRAILKAIRRPFVWLWLLGSAIACGSPPPATSAPPLGPMPIANGPLDPFGPTMDFLAETAILVLAGRATTPGSTCPGTSAPLIWRETLERTAPMFAVRPTVRVVSLEFKLWPPLQAQVPDGTLFDWPTLRVSLWRFPGAPYVRATVESTSRPENRWSSATRLAAAMVPTSSLTPQVAGVLLAYLSATQGPACLSRGQELLPSRDDALRAYGRPDDDPRKIDAALAKISNDVSRMCQARTTGTPGMTPPSAGLEVHVMTAAGALRRIEATVATNRAVPCIEYVTMRYATD